MPSPDERQVLKIVADKGGETNIATVAARMGVRYDYATVICNSVGVRDYVDILKTGRIKLTSKGWKAIGKSPIDKFGEKTEGLPSVRDTIMRQFGGKPAPQAVKDTEAQEKSGENTVICPLCGSKVSKTVFLKKSAKAAQPFHRKGGAKNPLDWFKDMTQPKPKDLPSVQETIMTQLGVESEPASKKEPPKTSPKDSISKKDDTQKRGLREAKSPLSRPKPFTFS